MEPVVLAGVSGLVPAHSCQLGLKRHCNASLNTTQQLHRWSSPDKALLLLFTGNTEKSKRESDKETVMANTCHIRKCPEVKSSAVVLSAACHLFLEDYNSVFHTAIVNPGPF